MGKNTMIDGMKGMANVAISQMLESSKFFIDQGIEPEKALEMGAYTAMFNSHKGVDRIFGGMSAAQITHQLAKKGKQ